MNVIKLALLNRMAKDIDETAKIEEAVRCVEDISVIFSGERISLDHEVLEFARKHYKDKLAELKKGFEEA